MKIPKLLKSPKIFLLLSLIVLCTFLGASEFSPAKKADMVIFSYDRPMQLYALLESIQLYMTGLGAVQIIFRASDDRYAQAYEAVAHDFPGAAFIKQGLNPRQDFKPLTLKASFETPNEYIIYAVDDIIVKDFIDLSLCVDLLEKTQAWGFYLRLGTNITDCYACNCPERVPPCMAVQEGVLSWQFCQGSYDWGYPHTVDMTLYHKRDIEKDVREMGYSATNSFEANWAGRRPGRPCGLCYEQSKIVNLPLNRVQNDVHNRNMNFLTPLELLERFEKGERINIGTLFKLANKGPHTEYAPVFIGSN